MKKLIIVMLLLFVCEFSFAQDKTSTIFIPIESKGISDVVQLSINQKIYRRLLADKNINLVKINPANFPKAATKSQAMGIAKKYNADHVIFGSISFADIENKDHLGEEGADQYIIVKSTNRIFKVSITLADVKSGTNLKSGVKNSPEDDVEKNSLAALGPILRYFVSNPDFPKEVVVSEKTDENQTNEENVEEEPVDDAEEKSSVNFKISFGIALNNQFALFDYQDITVYNGGLTLYAQIQNLFAENTVFKAEASFNSCLSYPDGVDSYYNFTFSLGGGYRFYFSEKLAFTPLISAGVLNHFIESSSVNGLYTDPMINFEIQFEFSPKPQYSVFIRPGYNFIIEKSLTGQYASFQLGFQYNLE